MKKAFTLAEVLITLMIIGVIAAMTIPTLNVAAHKKVNAEGCKKAFVVLSEAVDIAKVQDPIANWSFTDNDTTTNFNKIKPYLNIVKECIGTSGCWIKPKALNDGVATNFGDNGYGSPNISFKTGDGMNIAFDVHGESFNVTRKRSDTILFAADVNGDNPPNRVGDDVFIYVLGDNELLPAGNNVSGNGDCTRAGEGRDCAARVLFEGAINY